MSNGLGKEIVKEFQLESKSLIRELEALVETLEEHEDTVEFPSNTLSEFAQRIDRIMGAARTIATFDPKHVGLKRVGSLCALCKRLGYTAAEKQDARLLPIFAGFWADTLENVEVLIDAVEDPARSTAAVQKTTEVLQKRLAWLAGHLGIPADKLAKDLA